MKNFNVNRFNCKKIELGESPITLVKETYPEIMIQDGYLVDAFGKRMGTKGDMYTKKIMDMILEKGCLDHHPRPYYEDFYEEASYHNGILFTKYNQEITIGENERVEFQKKGIKVFVPAHTISLNQGVECTYDLSKGESPMITLRPIAVKSAIAEVLWIYQKQSNDLVEFDTLLGKNTWEEKGVISNWWEEWAIRNRDGSYALNEEGHPHIGACYGGTTSKRNMIYQEVIEQIRSNPDGRRNITSLWQMDDFKNPHALKPCAFMTIWNVRHDWDGTDYLDMTLVQRSSDFATAGCINQVQYVALQKMIAKELGYVPGTFTWKPINIQLYDRHLDQAIEMLNRDPILCNAEITLKEGKEHFEEFDSSDITITDYPRELVKTKNPQLKFPLGI